jgi:hypothetical protein
MTTTITALPTRWAILDAALRNRHPVMVSYHGRWRQICPHALGWKDHRPLLLGYQTGGHTTDGQLPADPHQRWRCLYVDEIDQVIAASPDSPWQSADNYNPAHPFPAIDTISVAITPSGHS